MKSGEFGAGDLAKRRKKGESAKLLVTEKGDPALHRSEPFSRENVWFPDRLRTDQTDEQM